MVRDNHFLEKSSRESWNTIEICKRKQKWGKGNLEIFRTRLFKYGYPADSLFLLRFTKKKFYALRKTSNYWLVWLHVNRERGLEISLQKKINWWTDTNMKPPEQCYRFHETKIRISNQLDGHRCLTDQNFQSKKFAPFFQFPFNDVISFHNI